MSCCPVAVKLGVQPFIFAVDLKSFRVGVYRVISFSMSVFFVTFLQTYFRYPCKAHHFSANDLIISNTTLDQWCQLHTSKRTAKLKELRAMKNENKKSLLSAHFVCVQAVGSLGCSLAITSSSFSVCIWVQRLS